MSRDDASEVARRLAQNAEAVCRHYLSNGRREGRVSIPVQSLADGGEVLESGSIAFMSRTHMGS